MPDVRAHKTADSDVTSPVATPDGRVRRRVTRVGAEKVEAPAGAEAAAAPVATAADVIRADFTRVRRSTPGRLFTATVHALSMAKA